MIGVSVVEPPSYEQLALLVVDLTGELSAATALVAEANSRLDEADARISALEAEVAALRAQQGKSSSNSSKPPSSDGPAAKAQRKQVTSQRERSADRKRGGQPGRKGSGLQATQTPDETRRVEAAVDCSGCGADLVEHGRDAGTAWAQVWDLKPIELEKVHYVLPKRRCACCGKLTTASVPFATAGSVSSRAHDQRGSDPVVQPGQRAGRGHSPTDGRDPGCERVDRVRRPRSRAFRRPARAGRVRRGDDRRVAGRGGAVRR